MLTVMCTRVLLAAQAAAESGIEAERQLVKSQLREEDARLQLAAAKEEARQGHLLAAQGDARGEEVIGWKEDAGAERARAEQLAAELKAERGLTEELENKLAALQPYVEAAELGLYSKPSVVAFSAHGKTNAERELLDNGDERMTVEVCRRYMPTRRRACPRGQLPARDVSLRCRTARCHTRA